jgi:hypothetical protein
MMSNTGGSPLTWAGMPCLRAAAASPSFRRVPVANSFV